MQSISNLLNKEQYLKDVENRRKHVTKEYQDYGLRLATQLGDPSHKSLYIKLAKDRPRAHLEIAFRFAIDYPKASGNKGRLFMWKLKQIGIEIKEKEKLKKESDDKTNK